MLLITPVMLLTAVREFGIQGMTGMFLPVSKNKGISLEQLVSLLVHVVLTRVSGKDMWGLYLSTNNPSLYWVSKWLGKCYRHRQQDDGRCAVKRDENRQCSCLGKVRLRVSASWNCRHFVLCKYKYKGIMTEKLDQ